MSSTATITLNVVTSGLPAGREIFAPAPVTLYNPIATAPGQALASGPNTIQVPAGTRYMCIMPPPGNGVALTLKGASGDTGITIDPVNPGVYPVHYPNGGSIVINAASAIAALTQIFFY